MRRKIVALMLAGVMATSFTACGGSSASDSSSQKTSNSNSVSQKKEEKKEAEKQEASIAESGYYISDDGMGDVYAYYGVTLNNPNADWAMQLPVLTITAKGEDGSIVGTSDQTLFYIAPNDTISFGSVIDCNGKMPATVEFSIHSGTFVPGDTSGIIPVSSFSVSNTSEIVQDYGAVSYTGEVANNSDSDIDMVAVTVLLKSNGSIVYGDTTYVDNMTAGTTKPFELSEYNLPEHDEYVISVQGW